MLNVQSMLQKTVYMDYVLVPVCVGVWAFTGSKVWLLFALVSLLTAYTKPLPRFHRWLMRKLLRAAR